MTGLILDHLWQSTLFTAAAALLALTLKRNSARVRYCLWFAASVKFLIPFAALTAGGATLLAALMPPVSAPGLLLLRPMTQPFSAQTLPISAMPAPGLDWAQIIAPLLLVVWGIGCAAILARWVLRWSRLQRIMRQAVDCSLPAPVPVKMAPSMLEPGLVGIWRPVILLPQGIAERLSQAEMDAILAHEICHLRRRDNLMAATHMLVEALFWFHPLVWWLGARLNAEREHACDESVLAAGESPQIYAESILKVCQFYLHSPLDCAAGISGADLKTRMETIMENKFSLHLNAAKKLLLAGISALVIAVPIATGVLTSPRAVAQTKVVRSQSTALNALGAVAPLATATVGPQIRGMLVRINFREGQMVKAGDVLAEIDPHQYATELQASEAALARDSAAYANAQLEWKRQQSVPGSSTAPLRSPTLEETVREDAATVKSDEANVAQAKLALSYTKVIAPFDGRVGLKHADIGNIVFPGTSIVVITQARPMSVLFLLPEDNIRLISDKLARGTKLMVQAYDRNQTRLIATGTLEGIDNQIDTSTGAVKLRAVFNNDDGSLFPGQSVNIRVLGGIAPN
jgi:RND family efflux transporter MFP subunit